PPRPVRRAAWRVFPGFWTLLTIVVSDAQKCLERRSGLGYILLMSDAHSREPTMFKTVLTLFRGSVAVAGEELEDRAALLILDQQMRDAAAAVERSKRALALAIAQDQQEGKRLETTCARIADLEVRAGAA